MKKKKRKKKILSEWVESVKLVMYMCVKGIDFVSLFHFNASFFGQILIHF